MIDATPERERVFNIVKEAYMRAPNCDWNSKQTNFVQYDGTISKIAKLLLKYTDHIMLSYNCFFCETDKGVARISAVSGEQNAIRLEYIDGSDYEWIDEKNNESD